VHLEVAYPALHRVLPGGSIPHVAEAATPKKRHRDHDQKEAALPKKDEM